MSGASISVWRRYANAMVLLLNVIVGTALVVTAYSGYESPVDTPIRSEEHTSELQSLYS